MAKRRTRKGRVGAENGNGKSKKKYDREWWKEVILSTAASTAIAVAVTYGMNKALESKREAARDDDRRKTKDELLAEIMANPVLNPALRAPAPAHEPAHFADRYGHSPAAYDSAGSTKARDDVHKSLELIFDE